jgi:putative membrane protein
MASVAGHVAMHGSLFLAALCFWKAVLALSGSASWKSILALLVTGKLACLLGVLLIFAPRLLYLALAGGHVHGGVHDLVVTSSLADQQLAGLLMIAACPLSYLLAGVVIATRMIRDLGRLDYAIASRQQLGPEVVL